MEGQFNGGFFASLVWGAYIWRGLFSEFYGITVRKLEELFTMSSELSRFLIAAYSPSGCHAILLHQDSQIYNKMTSPSLKENIIDKN